MTMFQDIQLLFIENLVAHGDGFVGLKLNENDKSRGTRGLNQGSPDSSY